MWEARVKFRILTPKSSTSLYFSPLAASHSPRCLVYMPTFPTLSTLTYTNPQPLPMPVVCTPVLWPTYHMTYPGKKAWGHLGGNFRGPGYPEHGVEGKVG